jgi:hypothetical protein
MDVSMAGIAFVQTSFGRRTTSMERAAYFESSVASIWLFVATIAGAMTIPIKARAIKRSCIGILLVRRPGRLCMQWGRRLNRQAAFPSGKRHPVSEAYTSPALENCCTVHPQSNHRLIEKNV